MKITMNTERQNTISHGSVRFTLRIRIPPVLQHNPAAIIKRMPFRRGWDTEKGDLEDWPSFLEPIFPRTFEDRKIKKQAGKDKENRA
jgi:hypothetical protein